MSRALVTLANVHKAYGHVVALNDLSLDIAEGEFLTILGPSGSGKTTTPMLIAGFERPTRGGILIRGESVVARPPEQRDIGMVFQSYALFPHMTVFDNVAFPLRTRRLRRHEVTRRVSDALESVRLPGLERRYPRQLSGGQQQRVRIAIINGVSGGGPIGGYRRDRRRVGGEGRPAASAGGAPRLLVEERDAEQDHPQEQEGEDAVRGPDGGEIHEEHLEHREAEERQRGIADGRARADEAPAERGRRQERPEDGEPDLGRPAGAAALIARPVHAQHEEQREAGGARQAAAPDRRLRRGRAPARAASRREPGHRGKRLGRVPDGVLRHLRLQVDLGGVAPQQEVSAAASTRSSRRGTRARSRRAAQASTARSAPPARAATRLAA